MNLYIANLYFIYAKLCRDIILKRVIIKRAGLNIEFIMLCFEYLEK